MKKFIQFVLFIGLFTNCEKELIIEFTTFTDSRDSIVYDVVTIGSQTWMAENLRYLPEIHDWSDPSEYQKRYYVHGYSGTSVEDAKNSPVYVVYGVFYNCPAAQYACPNGWRIPDEEDWEELRKYVGKKNGEALRSEDLWRSSLEGNNSSGFNLRPFPDGRSVSVWSTGQPTDVKGRQYVWGFWSYPGDYKFVHDDTTPDAAAYVRCIKDQ